MPKLSLRQVMTLGVALGILLPALVMGSLVLKQRYDRELELRIHEPLFQYTQLLSSALAMPIWNVDKVVAKQLMDAVMRNPDVVEIVVEDEFGHSFVSGDEHLRRKGLVLSQQSNIVMDSKQLGTVRVGLSTDRIVHQLWIDFTQLGLALLAQMGVSFLPCRTRSPSGSTG